MPCAFLIFCLFAPSLPYHTASLSATIKNRNFGLPRTKDLIISISLLLCPPTGYQLECVSVYMYSARICSAAALPSLPRQLLTPTHPKLLSLTTMFLPHTYCISSSAIAHQQLIYFLSIYLSTKASFQFRQPKLSNPPRPPPRAHTHTHTAGAQEILGAAAVPGRPELRGHPGSGRFARRR